MRSFDAIQAQALKATDRSTYVRVWYEDGGGTLRNMCDLHGEDWFEECVIDHNVDAPISQAKFRFGRKVGTLSLVPLDENSPINQIAGSYAPFLYPYRDMRVDVCTLASGARPLESDWVVLWEGISDSVDWGGDGPIEVVARDPMARLNDTFVETAQAYGADDGSKPAETVIQEILTANISSPSMTLSYSPTSFAIRATQNDGKPYEILNVTVLQALLEIVDLFGWNLSWRWDSSANAMRLTLWEPQRNRTSAQYEFTPDDYYAIPRASLALDGIRNDGEVVYVSEAGTTATYSDSRTASVALYGTRFIRVDARGTSVVTLAQATNMLDNILDDTEEPFVQQQIECAFFWPAELGDTYSFAPNDHYSTAQQYSVFGLRHVLMPNQKRTLFTTSGKPSGGFERWHNREVDWTDSIKAPVYEQGESLHVDVSSRSHTGDTATTTMETVTVPAIYQTFNPGGAKQYAIKATAMFSTSGAGGTKDVAIAYGGAGHVVTIASGTQTQRMEVTITPVGSDTVRITLDYPESAPFSAILSNPFDVDEEQDITFTVDLANAGDTATLQMSAVQWLGESVL